MKEKIKSTISDYYLEIIILFIVIILVILNPNKAYLGLKHAFDTYKNMFLVIISIALLTGLISETVSKENIKKIIGKENGFKGVLIGAIFGTLMVGPAYAFYPFLKEMMNKGAKINIIVTTINTWAIKLQWFPFAIVLLGWKFIITLNILIFIFTILFGYVVEYLVDLNLKTKLQSLK